MTPLDLLRDYNAKAPFQDFDEAQRWCEQAGAVMGGVFRPLEVDGAFTVEQDE